ncbi:hypothetical protein H6P81_005939 [Aristolochia fimbriata]|uniref:Uncharacterized protein n=1 Tax=Aristolochia fimbriata TaxID=158543 RepID=A0AAV7EVX4_ARIFI|nr:hypothetical protein H6P81_005939 [Aristolochia fimbriata]
MCLINLLMLTRLRVRFSTFLVLLLLKWLSEKVKERLYASLWQLLLAMVLHRVPRLHGEHLLNFLDIIKAASNWRQQQPPLHLRQICFLFQFPNLVAAHAARPHGRRRGPCMVSFAEQFTGFWRGHASRALFMVQSPDGCTVASAAGDKKLLFWNAFGTLQVAKHLAQTANAAPSSNFSYIR